MDVAESVKFVYLSNRLSSTWLQVVPDECTANSVTMVKFVANGHNVQNAFNFGGPS